MFEEEEKSYLINIINYQKKQREKLFSYLNFLSCKRDDYRENYLNYKYNSKSPKENRNFDISEEEIKKKNENYMKFIETEYPEMYKFFEKLGQYLEYHKYYQNQNLNCQEIYKYYEKHKLRYLKIYLNKEITLRSDFLSLTFKNMVNIMEDSIIRESVKADRKMNYYNRNKISNKFPRLNNNNERNHGNINDYFKEYIKSYYKESNIDMTINIIDMQKKNMSKFRTSSSYPYQRPQQINNSTTQYFRYAMIYINIFPFKIHLSFQLNKEIQYNNYKFNLSLKDEYRSQISNELILYKKVKALLYERIISINNLIYEEKRRKNINNNINNINTNSNIIFDNEFLKEMLFKFINYINDFYLINKIKCHLCDNIIKYSYAEKCFLPPFYKLYNKEKKIYLQNLKNVNEVEPKLFYHEDCFKKIANPSI